VPIILQHGGKQFLST